MNWLKSIFGDQNQRTLKSIEPIVKAVNDFEEGLMKLSDAELQAKTGEFKSRLEKGETLDQILPEAFAVVRETSRRVTGMRHFDVQIIGGIIIHRGGISEMRTGEGKTLVATLPIYLNALLGKGIHVVTVNDYLSRRDAVWMGQIYSFLGLSLGVINGSNTSYLYDPLHKEEDATRDQIGSFKVVYEFLRPCSRKEAYLADITYGTNSEFGFDFLRDNIAYRKEDLVQRPFYFAIVDEIDSILIDEARTPLIISASIGASDDSYIKFAEIASRLVKDEDYTVDEKSKTIAMLSSGIQKAEDILGIENIYTEGGIKQVFHLETAVRARALFELDRDYVIREGEVVIVDQFTGRMQPGRRWSEGLHQAIEAKERVNIKQEARTFASITYQNFFRMYEKLAGMTGTALTSSEEFYKVYGLDTVTIPTNKPVTRKDKNDLIFQTEPGKFKAIARRIKELNTAGQPVLVGTVSIEKSELLSQFLTREKIEHTVLNAKNHEREGEIIAQAGRKGSVTIATNMAGRGVDIKLGGSPSSPELYEEIKSLGGLYVIGTERHEARRIDNQLRGRSGRQGDPGETQFFVSLEDPLMRVFASDTIKRMMGSLGMAEDEPIENSIITRSLESAQTKIEGFNFDSRKHVLQYDDVINVQRKVTYARRYKILSGGNEELIKALDDIIADDSELRALAEEKRAALGDEDFFTTLRRLLLQTIDTFWVDHLETMDYLRNSVGLRGYAQKDPLVEYKRDASRIFNEMQANINEEIKRHISHLTAGAFIREEKQLAQVHEDAKMISSGSQGVKKGKTVVNNDTEEIGRNDLCPCGSGKKYKKCHGK